MLLSAWISNKFQVTEPTLPLFTTVVTLCIAKRTAGGNHRHSKIKRVDLSKIHLYRNNMARISSLERLRADSSSTFASVGKPMFAICMSYAKILLDGRLW